MHNDEIHLERLPEPLPSEPMQLLAQWLQYAIEQEVSPNANAMALATVDTSVTPPLPDARVVLCKSLDAAAGKLVFYTNYHSVKGRQLDMLPIATAVFHWDVLELQARVRGPVTRTSAAESDAYFSSRPLLSRLGAWASKQSQPVRDRATLAQQLEDIMARFDISDPRDPEQDRVIPRPEHWGGYELWAQVVELWIGQRGRLHERGRWQRQLQADGDGFSAGAWQSRRLQP